MTRFYTDLSHWLDKRARYNRTRKALRSMPLDVALDLDIYPGDADRLARHAVYGAAKSL
jgi:hypothetical protein